VLFAKDWVGKLTDADVRMLAKHGPKPYGQAAATQSIDRCPDQFSRRLDRVIRSDVRLGVQRATVLDWLYAARVRRMA
jgi:hypothetical protein